MPHAPGINLKLKRIMKTLVFIFLALPFAVWAKWDPYGVLSAEVNGNSVTLRNDSVQRNCASYYAMEVIQLEGDTLAWYQLDLVGWIAYCMCNYDLSVTLDSLNPGNYFVKTFFTDFPYPEGDTIYIGLISFTITGQNSFAGFTQTNEYQSMCYSVGMEEEKQTSNINFSFSPNPVKDKITISSPSLTENTHLSIFNVSGEKVMERELNHNETQIDISALPRGVYFVKLQNEKMVDVGKMVKE
jgi:hypothetical protein